MKKITKLIVASIFVSFLFCSSIYAAVPEPYKPLLQKYVSDLSNSSYNSEELGDFGGGMYPGPDECLRTFGYNFTDLNSDGSPELLIGTTYDGSLAAVYTIENNNYKLIEKQLGSDTQLFVSGSVPGDAEASNSICKSDYLSDGTVIYRFYKLNGSNKAFTVSYAGASNNTYYRSTDENNPIQGGEVSMQPLSTYMVNNPITPFNQFNPNESSQPQQPSIQQGSEGAIYRLYNGATGEHLYTPDFNEATVLSTSHGWTYEDIGWIAPTTKGNSVYRLYNPTTASHLYTTDTNEVQILTTERGWQADNNGRPLFYSGGSVPIYRLYNPETGMHHLTKDENEYNVLGTQGWNQEGPKLYALSDSDRTVNLKVIFIQQQLTDYDKNDPKWRVKNGTITLTNVSSREETKLTTNEKGEAYVENFPVGDYSISMLGGTVGTGAPNITGTYTTGTISKSGRNYDPSTNTYTLNLFCIAPN